MGFLTIRERWLIAGVVALFVLGGTVRFFRSQHDLNSPVRQTAQQRGDIADG